MTEKIITEDLEKRARENPDKTFEGVFITIDVQNPDENRAKLIDYVNKNKIKGRVGYLSELSLTGEQILYLSNQQYIKVISTPDPKSLRAGD